MRKHPQNLNKSDHVVVASTHLVITSVLYDKIRATKRLPFSPERRKHEDMPYTKTCSENYSCINWPGVYLVLDHVIVNARKYGIANASAM